MKHQRHLVVTTNKAAAIRPYENMVTAQAHSFQKSVPFLYLVPPLDLSSSESFFGIRTNRPNNIDCPQR